MCRWRHPSVSDCAPTSCPRAARTAFVPLFRDVRSLSMPVNASVGQGSLT
jgi:hypothetical protein